MLFGRIFGAVASVALIRYLGAEKQGLYSYIINTIFLFGFFAEFGITSILIREMKISGSNGGKLLGNAIAIQAVQLVLSVVLVAAYTFLLEGKHEIRPTMMLAVFSFMLLYLANPFQATLNSYEKMYITGLIAGISSIINAAMIFTAIYFKMDINKIIILLGISNLINVILSVIMCNKFAVYPVFKFEKELLFKLLKYSLPLGIIGVFNYIFLKVDVFLLFRFVEQAQVGYYSAVTRILDIVTSAMLVIILPFYPRFSYVFSTDSAEKGIRIVNLSLKYIIFLTAPFVLMVSFFSGEYAMLILGKKFTESGPILGILIWSILVLPLGSIFSYAIVAVRLTKALTFVMAAVATINVCMNIILIPRFGITATAVLDVVSKFLAFLGAFMIFNMKVGKSGLLSFAASVVAGMAVMLAVMWLAGPRINYILASISGGAAYVATLVALKYFGRGEYDIVRNIFKKTKPV